MGIMNHMIGLKTLKMLLIFLGQMVELKSQFTEMKSQQQILLESMKCIQNLWSISVTINKASYGLESCYEFLYYG